MNLLDASALLCFLQGEEGAGVVERELQVGAVCSAANWSEVAHKLISYDRDWQQARGLLLSYGLRVESVTAADAEAAARLWRSGGGLSLGDRLCIATGQRLGASIWTADAAWGSGDNTHQIR